MSSLWLFGGLVFVIALATFVANLRRRRAPELDLSSPYDEKHSNSFTETEPVTAKSIDPSHSEIPERVTRSIEDHVDRGKWVLRLSHHVFSERHQSRHNVVVINNELEYHLNVKDIVESFKIKFYQHKNPRVVSYEVVVFKEGTLVNMGDGGDINWDWMGNFTMKGSNLLSFKPCKTGVSYKQDPWLAS